LLHEGNDVIGIDAFTEYYDRRIKERNIAGLVDYPRFGFIEADVATADLATLLEGCEAVFHLAAQPGVRGSWGDDFQLYVARNIWATQRLLEAARARRLRKLVFASSSSVYGNAERYPTSEQDLPQPVSPYGVTKLATEQLCLAYGRSYGMPVVGLRYFTVYGPRQRPDMAFSRFIASLSAGREIPVYGDGKQTRDFTYVSDAVEATLRAATHDVAGEVLNVGGGSRVSVLEVLSLLSSILERPLRIDWQPPQLGDVRDTGADLQRAHTLLDYVPRIAIADGLRAQVSWGKELAY
jgi:UDP-glucose 4-epimerase